MSVFVDVETGTWGNAESLRILPDEYLPVLMDMDADSDICALGIKHGEKV